MRRLHPPTRAWFGAMSVGLALAACGGGSDGTSPEAAAPTVDPTLAALSGQLPADTEVDATKPLPDSLQSPANLIGSGTPSDDQLPPG